MAWDATLPADSTKIRDLGTVIRPNWVAIEQAGSTFKPYAVNFIDRTPSVAPIDPVAVSGSMVLYCKRDAAAAPQLYCINPSSTILQLTGMGTIRAWARFNGNSGAIAASFNVTSVTRNSIGNFTVAFTTALSSANYAAVVTAEMNSAFTVGGICGVGGQSTTGFNIYTKSLTTVDGANLNPVNFIVIGY